MRGRRKYRVRYGTGMTYAEIGRVMGISHVMVIKIERAALAKLRALMEQRNGLDVLGGRLLRDRNGLVVEPDLVGDAEGQKEAAGTIRIGG